MLPCAPMLVSEFDYSLPVELIAQHPTAERRASRLLVVGAELTGGFVCEVQLNLSAMYAAKSSGGHRRYILARDARGD